MFEVLRGGSGGRDEDQNHHRGNGYGYTKPKKRGQMWEQSERQESALTRSPVGHREEGARGHGGW